MELSDIREGENNVAVAPDSTYTARLSQHLRIGMTSTADLLDSPLPAAPKPPAAKPASRVSSTTIG